MSALVILTEEQLERLLERAVDRALARSSAAGPQAFPPTLSTAQAAQRAGVTAKTVRAWISSGELPAGHRGRARTVLRVDLETYLAGAATPAAALLARLSNPRRRGRVPTRPA